jgi:hypothetical protein
MTTNRSGLFIWKRASYVVCAAAVTLLIANCTYASTLIGTVVAPSVESISEMNDLIDDYNSDFSASLPPVDSLLDKVEGQSAADFTQGNLALSDFNFFYQDDTGTDLSLSVFDSSVDFTLSTLGPLDGFDTLDNPVHAFEQLSGPSFTYYVSKDGNLGWSLWLAMDGVNPVYTDAGTGFDSITGTDFTRGDITDNSLAYDPISSGVSHISYYTATMPEPSTLLLGALASVGLLVRRRK